MQRSIPQPTENLFDKLSDKAGIKVEPAFDGSKHLLPQVKSGKQAALFINDDLCRDYVKGDSKDTFTHEGYGVEVDDKPGIH